MAFFRSALQLLVKSCATSLLVVVSEKVIRQALINNQKYVWQDQDQKVLESFLNGSTGAKLMAHLDSSCSGMLVSASNAEDTGKAKCYLDRAKGFSLAIGLIRLSCPTPFVVPEKESKQEEEEKKQEDPFIQIKSSPTIF